MADEQEVFTRQSRYEKEISVSYIYIHYISFKNYGN